MTSFSAESSVKDWRSGKEKLVEVMYVCKAVNLRIQAANTFNKRHEAQQRKVCFFYFKRCTRPLNNFNYDLMEFPIFTRVLLLQAASEILTNGIYTGKKTKLKGMTKIGRSNLSR